MKSSNSSYNSRLDDAANAIISDNRELAHSCIESIFPGAGDLVEAWLIKAWTCDSLYETEIAIQQALEIEPDHQVASFGLKWIQGIQKLASTQRDSQLAAEEEARRVAEEEARFAAEEESRRVAEEEARLAAEEESRRVAEEEARLAAEEESRRVAEEEARFAAEEESRRVAEEESRRVEAEEARLATAEDEGLQSESSADIEDPQVLPESKSDDGVEAESPFGCSSLENDEYTIIESELMESVGSIAQEIRHEVRSTGDMDTTPIETERSPREKQLVLAVDDSPTVRKLVSLTLSSAGYEVLTANDGIEALNIIAERLPDIILSDINMPKLNGYKLCKFVKKHVRTRAIPVVMLSGKDGVFDKMRGKMNGCDDFIAKPFESADLIEKVREHLTAAASRQVDASEAR